MTLLLSFTDGNSSQGSTWKNLWRKIRILLPYMWPKKSIGLQLRVLACITLLIGVRVTNVFVPIFSKKIVDELAEKKFAWGLILAFVGLKMIQGEFNQLFNITEKTRQIFSNKRYCTNYETF